MIKITGHIEIEGVNVGDVIKFDEQDKDGFEVVKIEGQRAYLRQESNNYLHKRVSLGNMFNTIIKKETR